MKVLHAEDTGKTRVDFSFEDTPDVSFTLVYDFNKIVEAEAVCGISLLPAVFAPSRMNGMQLRGMLYALASTHHPSSDTKTALEHAGDLITKDVNTCFRAVAACCGVNVPDIFADPANVIDDDSLFSALETMVIERPMALVSMLARLQIPVPPALTEAVASAPDSVESTTP
jgi:hypothetical protein